MASVEVPPLSQLGKQWLKNWLSRFVMEVRTKKVCSKLTSSYYSLWNNEAFTPELCLHEMLQADWSMRGPIFHLET